MKRRLSDSPEYMELTDELIRKLAKMVAYESSNTRAALFTEVLKIVSDIIEFVREANENG